ncbi:DUF1924 domain-containing protein [Ralstonia pickettii]|uniref:DUF1924 domain-containing protein n=1 Tax=Ralstonia pickettii TaxID=329 RepID=UPI002714CC7C|nr:DUF1924 domain-containing protein [Ralstonia pickettii]WKZ85443.1 DUF1924 domain-containing protein [Ralstonia pickettii]
MPTSKFLPVACLHSVLALALAAAAPLASAEVPTQMLDQYRAKAGTPSEPSRGQQFFTSKHGREWSCASCHGNPPTQTGRHAATSKSIAPLAPAFNPERFTDAAKTEKWFRRNCNDVVGRECTATEKADVLSWLMTLGK